MTDSSHSKYLAPVHKVPLNTPMTYSEHFANMAPGVQCLVLGPMPARQFIDTFFPLKPQEDPSLRQPAFKEGMFERLIQANKEELMYQPFVRTLYLLFL